MKRCLLFMFLLFFSMPFSDLLAARVPREGKFYEVHRVIDGDTFVLRNEERVRLIGIDAPEVINSPKLHRDARQLGVKPSAVKSMGLEAKSFLSRLLEGKKIRLEYDGPTRDRNGRVLAHVYQEDGSLVVAEILKQGYGTLLKRHEKPAFRHQDIFKKMQKEAMEEERGIWRFISDREYQLIVSEYEELTPEQRKNVLEYIHQLKNGNIPESYTPPKVQSPRENVEVSL